MQGATPVPRALQFAYSDCRSLSEYVLATHGEAVSRGSVPLPFLDSIVVAQRRRVPDLERVTAPLLLNGLGRRQDEELQLALILRIVHRNLTQSIKCALSKGHRLAFGDHRAAADAETDVLCLPGSTHRDQFLAKDWIALLRIIGTSGMASLLGSVTHAVFRQYSNGCFHQLAGVMMDEDVREILLSRQLAALVSASASASAIAIDTRAAGAVKGAQAAHASAASVSMLAGGIVASGKWTWPRSDVRVAGPRWQPTALLPSAKSLLNHAASTHRPGLPADHSLTLLSKPLREQRRVRLGLRVQRGAAAPVYSSTMTATTNSSTIPSTTSSTTSSSSHEPSCGVEIIAPALPASNNSARRLINAIFVRSSHMLDLALHHSGRAVPHQRARKPLQQPLDRSRSSAQPPVSAAGAVDVAVGSDSVHGNSGVPVARFLSSSGVQSSVNGSTAAAGASGPSGLIRTISARPSLEVATLASSDVTSAVAAVTLAAVSDEKDAESSSLIIPGFLQPALPSFRALIERHASCRYGDLLNMHCPRRDISRRRSRMTTAASVDSTSSAAADVESTTTSAVAVGRKRPRQQAPHPAYSPPRKQLRPAHGADGDSVVSNCGANLSDRSSSSDALPRGLSLASSGAPARVLLIARRSSSSESVSRCGGPISADLLSDPAALATPHAEVMNFVRAVLLTLLPPPLWGNNVSRRAILRGAWLWITSGTKDQLRVDAVTDGLPTTAFSVFDGTGPPRITAASSSSSGATTTARASNNASAAITNSSSGVVTSSTRTTSSTGSGGRAPFSTGISSSGSTVAGSHRFPSPSERSRQARAVQVWVCWVILGLLNPLLRNNFYVTESEIFHHRPLYYRKPTWARMTQATLEQLRVTLRLSAGPSNGMLPLGVAPMRLLPKATGLRPIMNLSADPTTLKLGPSSSTTAAPASVLSSTSSSSSASALTRGFSAASTTSGSYATSVRSAPASVPVGKPPASGSYSSSAPAGKPAGPRSGAYTGRQSINKSLENVHRVLRFSRLDTPAVGGASVFGMDGIHKALRRFAAARSDLSAQIIALRGSSGSSSSETTRGSSSGDTINSSSRSENSTPPLLYIVTCDVKSAYDSLLQDIAVDTAAAIVAPGEYEIRHYVTVRCGDQLGPAAAAAEAVAAPSAAPLASSSSGILPDSSSPRVGSNSNTAAAAGNASSSNLGGSAGAGRSIRYHKIAVPLSRRQPFSSFAAILASRSRDAVFIDIGTTERTSRDAVVALLKQHVYSHCVVLPGGGTAFQGRGIPQGSILSSMLCNLYLARLEREALVPRLRMELQQQQQSASVISGVSPQQSSASIFSCATAAAAAASSNFSTTTAAIIPTASATTTFATTDVTQAICNTELPVSLLMRHTDDFVLMTHSLQLAHGFAKVVHSSFPEYNVFISPIKSQSSVDMEVTYSEAVAPPTFYANMQPSAEQSNVTTAGASSLPNAKVGTTAAAAAAHRGVQSAPHHQHQHLPSHQRARSSSRLDRVLCLRAPPPQWDGSPAPVTWCGLALDPCTGAVTSDYERYCGAGRVRDALTISLAPTAMSAVTRMLLTFIRPKCHAVFLDGFISPLPFVALNVFQLSLIAGAKFAVLLRVLQREHGKRFSADALVSVISVGMEYLVGCVRKQCPGRNGSGAVPAGSTAVATSASSSSGGGSSSGEVEVEDPVTVLPGATPAREVEVPLAAPARRVASTASFPSSCVTNAAAALARRPSRDSKPQPLPRTQQQQHMLLIGWTGTEWLHDSNTSSTTNNAGVPTTAMKQGSANAYPVTYGGRADSQLPKPVCPLRNVEIRWLYLTAFSRAMCRIVATDVSCALLELRQQLVARPPQQQLAVTAPHQFANLHAVSLAVQHASAPHRSPFFQQLDLSGQ